MPNTADRVPKNTSAAANRKIREKTGRNIRRSAGSDAAIAARLRALDEEWDVERTLEANAASLALAGVILGAAVDKRFLLLPGAVAAFLLQHALQGWCPPLPLLRRLGFRTMREIDDERMALKAMRGDFGKAKMSRRKAAA